MSTTADTAARPIRPQDRDAVVASLRAGVVPRRGLQHIQVGRADEIAALTGEVDRVAGGGASVRFLVGEYGAGKSFLMQLLRTIAHTRKLVTAHADLTPDRRLQASGGQARSLYAELMRNLSTVTKPDGAAISSVVERFATDSLKAARRDGVSVEVVIRGRLAELQELTGGYDFADVVAAYWRGYDTGDEALQTAAVRWLRAEIDTRTDARAALGVRTIIDDDTFYDSLKLFARFVRLAGFGGLLVCLDEMVNIYKMANPRSRSNNYEQILRILNDCLQGSAEGIGFVFGTTPDMLLDTRRGLYSYQALQSRLAANTFAGAQLVDRSGPVMRLANLTAEDMYVLLMRLRHLYASGDSGAYLLPDEALEAFMAHCSNRVGDAFFRTPRNTIKEFMDLLSVLEQNPGTDWSQLIDKVELATETNPDLEPLPHPGPDPDTSDSDSRDGGGGDGSGDSRGGGASDELASFTI